LQLQNNSATGVEVNPEAYTCTLCFQIKKNLVVQLWEWYIDRYINNYSRVKHENIIHKVETLYAWWIENLPNQVL